MPPDGTLDPHMPQPPRNRGLRLAVPMAIVAIVWLALSLWAVGFYGSYREVQLRGQASTLAVSAAGALTNALNQRLSQVRGLAAFVAVKASENEPGEIEREFPIFAASYYQQVPGIRNISVAPDFVVKLVYPPDAGNLKVVGNRLLEDRRPGFSEVVNRAIQTRGLAVHEPVEMIQGGLGLLARHAVFVGDRPWGAVGIAFAIAPMLESSRIGILEGYVWGLRTAAGNQVGGMSEAFAMQPVSVRIDLPEGLWEFALAPVEGWAKAAAMGPEMTALRIGLVVMGLGLLSLAWTLLQRRESLARQIADQNRHLTIANRELERFSFIVAHDLQEPLRSILSFSQLVERGLSDQLTEDQRQWLSSLRTAAQLMKALLHDVQIYLGENDAPLPKRKIPASEALAIAQRKLLTRINETATSIKAETLPMVWADHHRLSEVFLALIGNAIEYRSPERPPVISVTCRADGNFQVINVADNGIGIEDSYFDRIFEVFQRLHSRSAHPGTGMGLAIAKKMVEHLGGTIRVRSVVGQGSVFSIILPTMPTWAVDARMERT